MNFLSVDDIGKSFGGVVALQNVSFSVEEGAIFGVMGANGAGKTTLFAIIAGNTVPTTGEIYFHGQRTTGLKPHVVSRAGIARTFQIVRPFRDLSVRENVEIALQFGNRRLHRTAAGAEVMTVLELIGLSPEANRSAGALTLAQQKRLEVARALATGPSLLLLDEVMAGLTPTEVQEMMATVRTIRSELNITVMIVEHVMGALMTLSDHLVVLDHGLKIAEGAPATIAKDPAVQAAYLGVAS